MESGTTRKAQIIDAATAVFAEKGYRASTIADLARGANIGEATVYNHFNNKEEILLSVPIRYQESFVAEIQEQFTGIKEPVEKLRKFLWHYLWWCQKNEAFVRIFMLEIQPNPNYYRSDAYRLTKEVTEIPADILREGIRAGAFRDEVDARIFKKFVIGAMDHLLLTRLAFDRPFQPLDDYDDLAKAILFAIRKGNGQDPVVIGEVEAKRERVLLAAESLLSKKPFVQTSISEIAKKAGVGDGTIYEYFENKEDVLFCIFEKRMIEFTEAFDETLCPKRPETKLKHILWHFLNWVEGRREWALVYLREIIFNPRFYASDKHRAMREHDGKVMRILRDGQDAGGFRRDLTPHLFRALVFGPLHALSYPWAALRRETRLVNDLDALHDLVVRAVGNMEGGPYEEPTDP